LEALFKVDLTTANSTVRSHGSNIVSLQLNRSCLAGHYFAIHSFAYLHAMLVENRGTAGFAPNCTKCLNGTISNAFDSLVCRWRTSIDYMIAFVCDYLFLLVCNSFFRCCLQLLPSWYHSQSIIFKLYPLQPQFLQAQQPRPRLQAVPRALIHIIVT
jgi:hypothetical protein